MNDIDIRLEMQAAKTALYAMGFDAYFFTRETPETVWFPVDIAFRTAHTSWCGWCRKPFKARESSRRKYCSRICANLKTAARRRDVQGFPLVQVRIERDLRGNPVAPPRIEPLKRSKDAFFWGP